MTGAMQPIKPGRVLLTGASGYLGRLVTERLTADGWEVVPLSRNPPQGGIAFSLGQPVASEALAGCDALVHAAYDFSLVSRKDIRAVNIGGAARLFRAAQAAGIRRIVAISTISAFAGCQSEYGLAKLEIEKLALAAGACVIRPGLIYGPAPGAMFGRLVSQIRASSFVPIPGDGKQLMFTVHQDDLTNAVVRALAIPAAPETPVTVAHECPLSFRAIMSAIACHMGRKLRPIPIPWRGMWLGLRAAEIARVPLGLRSDSLVSLVNQNAQPDINADLLGVTCRPFSLDNLERTV
jgi:nucleoside-diphosphate-sugar epimerase